MKKNTTSPGFRWKCFFASTNAWWMLIFTQTTSSSAFSLSSFTKSSLLMILPPDFSLQPFSFQLFTQLVTPAQKPNHKLLRVVWWGRWSSETPETSAGWKLAGRFLLWLTVNGELAVCVENQLLYVQLFGLFQCSAGSLHQTQTDNHKLTALNCSVQHWSFSSVSVHVSTMSPPGKLRD